MLKYYKKISLVFMKKVKFLSANAIKIIAVISMIIDHIGYTLYPQIKLFHVIGRLAFPLFAYFIAEGCKYTKNKLKHFMLIVSLGVLFQSVYYLFVGGSEPLNIFITFSLSILLIYTLDEVKNTFFEAKKVFVLTALIFLAMTFFIFVICQKFKIDYGFFGVMLPVLISATYSPTSKFAKKFKRVDTDTVRLIVFTLGILLLALSLKFASNIIFALTAVPVIALYNGKRGKYNLKYFFYITYPLHMVVIYFIAQII